MNDMGVWIDTDMGFDDIAAILTVAHAQLEIDGVSLVFGNAPMDQVRRNAAAACKAFDWRFPVYIGRDMPVLGKLETAQSILGETGMPTSGESLPQTPPIQGTDAFPALCHWLQSNGPPRRILALGPLTNIAALVLARPDLVPCIDELTWMGGGLTRGNHTASAEFNALADPEAVAIVLSHGIRLRMVDLDFCRTIQAGPDEVQPIRAADGKNACLLADLLAGFIGIATSRGRPTMALYDPAAAAAFVRPDLVQFVPARIDMELSGALTRGRTVVETRETHGTFNGEFAASGHAEALKAMVLAALQWEAAK